MKLFLIFFMLSNSHFVLSSEQVLHQGVEHTFPSKNRIFLPEERNVEEKQEIITSINLRNVEDNNTAKMISLSGDIYSQDWERLLYFKNLEILSLKLLNQTSLKSKEQFEKLVNVLRILPNLKELDLTSKFVDDSFIEKISEISNIKVLNLSKTPILGFCLESFNNKDVIINVNGTLVDKSDYPYIKFFD